MKKLAVFKWVYLYMFLQSYFYHCFTLSVYQLKYVVKDFGILNLNWNWIVGIFLFITYNGFRISHWFLEHHFIKQHDQIEKDLQKKKHLRIKIPSHKNTFTKKNKKKLYHLIIKHFLRLGKHHLHNSHKTDSFLPFWDLYLFWKKKRQENGPKFTTIIYFSLFLTNFSVTWKVNYKTEEFTAESLFFTGSIFVGSHDTYKYNAWILVRGYVNSCARIIHKYWSSRDNKYSTVLS